MATTLGTCTNDTQRVEFLSQRYQQLVSLQPTEATKPKRRKKVNE